MSPSDYLRRYRNLQVALLDGITIYNVDVHEYRNATSFYAGEVAQGDHNIHTGMAAKDQLMGRLRSRGRRISTGHYELRYSAAGQVLQRNDTTTEVLGTLIAESVKILQPFQGKGSPEEIEMVLKLAVGCGLLNPTLGDLQRYCDENIGLDCNGFVGNYVRAEGHATLTPGTHISRFHSTGTKRAAISEIQVRDLIVFTNNSHIMVIDSITSNAADSFECLVAESCGSNVIRTDVHTDGLNLTHYAVNSVNRNKVFQVRRGRGWEQASRQGTFNVYIVGALS
jgi:hypothetical protein